MLKRKMRVAGVAVLCAAAVACQKSSPSPTSPTGAGSETAASTTDARTGVTIIAPRPAAPVNGASIPWTQQPITLTVSNAISTGTSPLIYTFDVATDAAFGSIVASKGGIGAGSGTTSVALDKLSGSKTYYWRARADVPSGTGPSSAIRSFSVGPEVVLGTPVLASPINGAQSFVPISLIISNVSRSGPAGPIIYTVDLSASPAFDSLAFSADVGEQTNNGQTQITLPATGFNAGQTYYWRTKATDTTNHIVSPYSATASFVVQSFNFATAKIWDNPPDLAAWSETARITSVEFTGFSMRVDFDRRDGPNRWPDQVPPGFSGSIQYTLGMCRNIGGTWNCSAVVQFWYGRDLDASGVPSEMWREWWYNPIRWGPLSGNPPQEGDLVGIFVGAGDLRGRSWTLATCPQVCERSNVVMVPFTFGSSFYQY